MKTKIKKTPIKMFVVIPAFLFACGSGSQPPTLKNIQAEHTSPATKADTVLSSVEANDVEITDTKEKTKSESPDDRPRNTKYADADGNPIYKYMDVYGRLHTLDYPDVEVKPLLNGKNGEDEFRKYLNENNKFQEIAEENNIQKGSLFYEFTIDTNGSVIDVMIKESSHPLFTAEMLRIINDTNGKWTPGKHDGDTLKVKMISLIRFP